MTCTVGRKPSKAQYYVNDVSKVSDILDNIKNIVGVGEGVRCRSTGRTKCARRKNRWMMRKDGRMTWAEIRAETRMELFSFNLINCMSPVC